MVKIFRYEVPIDDGWHVHKLSGAVFHVAARQPERTVEFWALESGGPKVAREFRVFGTGWDLPDEKMRHVGTAVTPMLVWHLMERAA